MTTFAPVESFNRMYGVLRGMGAEVQIGSTFGVEDDSIQHWLTVNTNGTWVRIASILKGDQMMSNFCHVVVSGDHLNVAASLRAVAELIEGQAA